MYPVIKASGSFSPGSAGTSSTVANTTARNPSYTFAVPATAKAGDALLVFSSADSGLPQNTVPVPSISGESFTLETTSGGDDTTTFHGRTYHCELSSDGTKTVTMAVPNGSSNTADTSVMWMLLDGSSIAKPLDPGWSRNTSQITPASTSHALPVRNAGDSQTPSGNYLAINFLVNDAADSSVSRAYTAPSGWTKQQEVGSREFLDSALMIRNFDGQTGYAAATATYGAAATYTRMTIFVPGAADFTVEHVATRENFIETGGRVWCDKPPGAAADNEPGAFLFQGQSTTKQRIAIQRFKNVHPTRPIAAAYQQSGNTTTAATSITTLAQNGTCRGCQAGIGTVQATSGTWNGLSPFTGTFTTIQPPASAGVIRDVFTSFEVQAAGVWQDPARTQNWSVAATQNHADIMLRASDTLDSGVEVLIAWHTMDASQNGSLQSYPDWSGWTELGRTIRAGTTGAQNIRCYMKIVESPKDTVWRAGVESEIADTTGSAVGYELPQTQTGSQSNPVTGAASAVPVQKAPGGRPGMASEFVIGSNITRLEQNPSHRQFVEGEEYYFGFSFYLDEDFPLNATSWQVVEQLHAAPSSGSPVVCFEVTRGQLRMTGGANKPDSAGASTGAQFAYDLLALDKLEKYRWYNVVYFVRFSRTPSNSRVDAWVDGTQVITNYQPPCATVYAAGDTPQGGPTYRKQGIYHDKSIAGGTIWHGGSSLARSFTGANPARTLNTRTHDHVSDFTGLTDGTAPAFFAARNGDFGAFESAYWLRSEANPNGTATTRYTRTRERTAGDLAWTSVSMEVVRVPVAAPDGSAASLMLWAQFQSQADGTRFGFEYDSRDGTLSCAYQVGYADSSVVKLTYSNATHRFWRVRNTGAYVIWETSQYGTVDSWVEQRRMAAPSWVNGKDASVSIETTRTTNSTGNNALFANIDNYNVVITSIQKSGTAQVGVNVGVTATGSAGRRGSAGQTIGVSVTPFSAKTSRSPNIAPITLGVQVLTPIAGKYRPGVTATTTLGMQVSPSGSKRISAVTVAVPQRVSVAVSTGRKMAKGTAQIPVGVNVGVIFGQRQRRAITTLGVSVGCSASSSRKVKADVSMGVNIGLSVGFKSSKGVAQVPIGVVATAIHTPPRKLYPDIRENYSDPQEGMRYYLQDVRTKEFIHTEFPLENEQITLTLSGPDIISGDFGFDIRDVEGIGMDGWSQWIHAEMDGDIATSGLLLPWTYESRMNALEANGPSIYPHGIPFGADKQYIQKDPMDIMDDIWKHVQGAPMGNLGVRFVKSPTPVRLGTEETEQVAFEAGGTKATEPQENLDAYVTVKRENVDNTTWQKLANMGYKETATGALAQAAQEMLNRVNSGGGYYEDFSWTGMSSNMARYNDTLADGFYARNKGNDVWKDRNKVRAFLQGVLAGGGTMSVKKRDLITAQGGTPGQTKTNSSGTNAAEQVEFEAGGPYKLNWYDDHDCGSKFDELIKVCPADYRERNRWNAGRTDVMHDIITGYPRLGRFLDEPTFTEDENIKDHVPLEEQPEDFATEIWVLGAGEGRDRIRGMASLTHPTRIRRVKVYDDKSITSKKVADALAKELLTQSQRPVSVRTVLIDLSHDFAPLGSFWPGDDIKVQLDVRGYGEINTFHRVAKMNWVPKTMLCAVDLIRSDTIRYGVAAT